MTLSEIGAAIELKSCEPTIPPYERYSGEIWRHILSRLPNYLPPWYRCLTMEFCIGGFFFHRSISERGYIGDFILPRPSGAMGWAYDVWPLPQLQKHGFSAFAEGSDGNAWIMRTDALPTDPVYFLESTAWNGDFPADDNGIIDPRCNFIELLEGGLTWKPN